MSQARETMGRFVAACRRHFVYAGVFSLFINVLSLTVSLYMLQVFDRVLTSRSEETLVMLSVVACGALGVMLVLDIVRGRLLLGAGIALDQMLGPEVLASLLSRAAAPADSGGQLLPGSARDVAVVRGFVTGPAITALFDAPWAPIYLALMFLFHPILGWTAVVGSLVLLALALANEKVIRAPLTAMSGQSRRAAQIIDQGIRNAELVSALGMADATIAHWQRANDTVIEHQFAAGSRGGLVTATVRNVRLQLQIVTLGIGAALVVADHLSSGIMMAGTMLLARALAPVESAVSTWRSVVEARGAWHRLGELLAGTAPAEAAVDIPIVERRLDVERLTFGVRGTDRLVIKGINFSIRSGEMLGVIGPSAAGKSTLARLLVGVWRPTGGAVRYAGADVATWPRHLLGPHIGYVPQDVELFAGTVAQNIARLGPVDSERVIEAAQRSFAHDMILKLPRGYETEIGASGAVLSGGQRQRIALARALYGAPGFIVLDEPNASLDAAGEDALYETLRGLKAAGTTIVMITHKPSMLGLADKILVLREGVIEAFGPREEILLRFQPRPPAQFPQPAGQRG